MLGLEREKFSHGYTGRRKQHDERDGLGFGDGDGRDHRALAVAEEPDAFFVDARILGKERYSGEGVLRIWGRAQEGGALVACVALPVEPPTPRSS